MSAISGVQHGNRLNSRFSENDPVPIPQCVQHLGSRQDTSDDDPLVIL